MDGYSQIFFDRRSNKIRNIIWKVLILPKKLVHSVQSVDNLEDGESEDDESKNVFLDNVNEYSEVILKEDNKLVSNAPLDLDNIIKDDHKENKPMRLEANTSNSKLLVMKK